MKKKLTAIFVVTGYLLWGVTESLALMSSSITVTFSQPAHFIGSDESDVVVQPGTYAVEGAEHTLRLTSEGDGATVSLTARPILFPEEVDSPVAMIIPLEQEEIYLAWVAPGGKGLEIVGSFNPVQKRGLGPSKIPQIPSRLTSQHINQLRSFGKRLAATPVFTKMKGDWITVVKYIAQHENLRSSATVDELLFVVMREAIVEANKDKKYLLKKLQTYNTMAEQLSQDLKDLHNQAKNLSGSEKAKIEQRIRSKEKEVTTADDDAQLANIDLQNTLQKVQQLLQMMSNISKQLHDTAMAVIRNLR